MTEGVVNSADYNLIKYNVKFEIEISTFISINLIIPTRNYEISIGVLTGHSPCRKIFKFRVATFLAQTCRYRSLKNENFHFHQSP